MNERRKNMPHKSTKKSHRIGIYSTKSLSYKTMMSFLVTSTSQRLFIGQWKHQIRSLVQLVFRFYAKIYYCHLNTKSVPSNNFAAAIWPSQNRVVECKRRRAEMPKPMQSNSRTKNVLLSMENLSFIVFRYFSRFVMLLLRSFAFSMRAYSLSIALCVRAIDRRITHYVYFNANSITLHEYSLSEWSKYCSSNLSSGVFIHSFEGKCKLYAIPLEIYLHENASNNIVSKTSSRERKKRLCVHINSHRCVHAGQKLI